MRGRGVLGLVATAIVLASAVATASASDTAQQAAGSSSVREARVLEQDRTGVGSPVGLAFSTATGSFFVTVAGQASAPDTEVVRLTPFAAPSGSDRAGSARLAAALGDPVNVAFDERGQRLLLLDNANRLLEVRAAANGDLDPGSLVRRDAANFGVSDPQGLALDPGSGTLYLLDASGPGIVRAEPGPDGSFDQAVVSEVALPASITAPRGLAFDPQSGHLQLRSGSQLLELSQTGTLLASRDLGGLTLASPQGMVFAPSGDRTDDPAQLSLYVADSGGGSTQSSGQIVELSLSAASAAATSDFTSALVSTVNLASLSPPSPDPSGITYVPAGVPGGDKLVISDGEVEETVNGITHFQGANVWELTRSGSVLRTANISKLAPTAAPITNEPVGMAFNPTNGHYYISDDGAIRIIDLNPGPDGLIGTSDDSWGSFSPTAENGDPEGITYDTFGGRLFVADGVNREVYQYTTAGALVSHFDVEQYGVQDPESVEFNPVSGTLFVLSDDNSGNGNQRLIVETATSGTLIQTIDVSATNSPKPAGLAYAPASNGSGDKRFYIVDRGVDNNVDPNAVDGKLYEMSAPVAGSPANTPPVVGAGSDQAVTLPASANLDGTVTDDGNPNPPGTVTTSWSQVSGPSTVTFGNVNSVDTTASAPVSGIYVVRLTASDGAFTAFDDATLTFSGAGSVQSLDLQVPGGPSDAEERLDHTVALGSSDLDMMTQDESNLVVGTRFAGVTIPKGASISAAYVQFQAARADSVSTSLTIRGQAADNPGVFTTNVSDISSRPTTTASATWSPDPWLAAGDTGLAQRTTNLAVIIQELVNRPGWASGNAVAFLITGSGTRVAKSYNASGPALLHVEYTTGSGNAAPQITSYGGGGTASVAEAENQTFAADVDAVDPDAGDTLTYAISGGADAARFTVSSTTGVVTFVAAPNFEAPTDVGANNVYDVTVTVSDGNGGTDSQAIAVTVLNVNEFAPVITSDGGGATAAIPRPENQTAVTTVTSTDGDGDPRAYSLVGGDDAAAFQIDAATGVLTFVSAPDFENPTDAGGNNVYDVAVDASDGSLSDTQAIAVTVTDVVEGTNQAPTVNAGSDQTITLPASATLDGTVTDDGLPNPPGAVTTTWTKQSGPGTVTFGNASLVDTTAGFSQAGTYVLRLTANDSSLPAFDELTVTVNPAATGSPLYLSLAAAGTVGGVAADDEDVLFFDGAGFSLAFDGSDVGISAFRIDAFSWLDEDSLLLSFDTPGAVPGITTGTVDDSDLVRFDATSLGPTTAGAFSLYFDGSDVGLTTSGEDVDAVEVLPNGNLLFSTLNTVAANGASGDDKDLLEFVGTLGANTVGTFSPYFDGSSVGLTTSGEDVDAAAVDASGRIYLSTLNNFSVTGVSGADEDVFVYNPSSNTFDPTLYFDGSAFSLAANDVSGIDLP